MALKITLKPGERMIIGNAVITNGATKTEFVVESNTPILRQKDIMSAAKADTPARRIYFCVQLMYVDGNNLVDHHKLYWELVRDFVSAAPSSLGLIDELNELIVQEKYYQALKIARHLMNFEQEVVRRANQCSESIPSRGPEDHVRTRNRSTCTHTSCAQTY